MSTYLKRAKTGDIIVFDSRCLNWMAKILILDQFSHSGMVVKKDGEIYIHEIVSPNTTFTKLKNGDKINLGKVGRSVTTPLISRLQNYDGEYFIYELEKPLTPMQESKLISNLKDGIRYCNFLCWEFLLSDVLKLRENKDTYCFKHLYENLYDVGLFKGKKTTGVLNVSRLMSNLNKARLNNNSYKPVKQILFDLDAE
jgi:hypothetical protein